jgi:stage V sporulation protein B
MTSKNKSLAGGVTVLSIAGLICSVVGVLYRIPLANLIGSSGMGIYQQVYPAYSLLLAISSVGIPVAISRMVSHSLSLNDPGSARRFFRTALAMLTGLGAVSTALLMLFRFRLAGAVGTPETQFGYAAIAPSVLLVCIMSAFRGYMQGRRFMLPTAVSQVIEQVGKVGIALPLAAAGMAKGGIALGAAGALLGITIAEAIALVYMIVTTAVKKKEMDSYPADSHLLPLSGLSAAGKLVDIAVPIALGACIVPLAGMVDSAMLVNIMKTIWPVGQEALDRFGLYSGIVLVMINVPNAIPMALSANLVPSIASGIARADYAYIAKESALGIRMASVIGIPCSVGMSMLARPILYMLYAGGTSAAQLDMTAELLTVSSLTIALFTLVQATSGILQGLKKQWIPMYTLAAGVACKVVLNNILVAIPSVNIHGAPISSLVCYTVSLVPNLYFVCKYAHLRLNVVDILVRPAAATLIMGAVVFAFWHFLFGEHALRQVMPVMVCLAAGFVSYTASAFIFRAIRMEDLPARLRKRKAA